MTRQQQADSGALEVLELLASGASHERLEQLLRDRRAERARPGDTAPLRAVRLGLAVHNRLARRQQSEARISALLSSARDVITADLDDTLEVVARRARLLFGFDTAFVGVIEPGSGEQVIRAADGHTSPDVLGLRLGSDAGLYGAAAGAPIWTSDYLADSRFVHTDPVDAVVRSENLHAVLAIPLAGGRVRLGTLFGAFRHVRSFNADEIAAMIALGELTAAAVERAGRAAGGAPEATQGAELVRADADDSGVISAVARCFNAASAEDAADFVREGGRLLGGSLTLFDADGTVLPAGSAPIPEEAGEVFPDGAWVAPVRAMGDVLGALRLKPDGPASRPARSLLDLVAHAAAILLLGRRAPLRDGADGPGRLVADLLATPPRSPRAIERRLTAAGLDPTEPLMVLVTRPTSTDSERVEAWADAYAHRLGGLSALYEGDVVVLIPGNDASAAAKHLHAELVRVSNGTAAVGAAGPAVGAEALVPAHREAARCLQAVTALGDGGGAAARDLGFVGLLLSERRDTEGFIEDTLGPLLDYDRSAQGALSDTLSAYFAAGNSPTHAAKELHVHPNTVARRLERVGVLLGKDWQSPARALEIQVALRLMRIGRRVEAYT